MLVYSIEASVTIDLVTYTCGSLYRSIYERSRGANIQPFNTIGTPKCNYFFHFLLKALNMSVEQRREVRGSGERNEQTNETNRANGANF